MVYRVQLNDEIMLAENTISTTIRAIGRRAPKDRSQTYPNRSVFIVKVTRYWFARVEQGGTNVK